MRKSFQNGKAVRKKARFFGRLVVRLMLAVVIGVITGKLLLSSIHPEHQDTGVVTPEHEAKPLQSPRRLKMEARLREITASQELNESDLPSPGSRAYLSLIKRLPTLESRGFFKLAQQSAGGATLQNAVLGEWAKRYPKEMFQTLHTAYPSEDDPRRDWFKLAIVEWMKQNPNEAIEVLDDIPRRIGRGGSDPHMSAIDAAKSSGNFGLALDLQSRWPNQVWSGLTGGAFENWYAGQPAVALAKIAKIGNADMRAVYLERIGNLAGGGSEEEILGTASSFSQLDRQAFLKGVVSAMAKDSPEAAVSFLSRNFEGSIMINAAEPAIREWSTKDPRAAILWSEENLHGQSRDKVVSGAIRQVASQDKELASDLVKEMSPGSARNEAAAIFLEVRMKDKDPQLAEWIESFPDGAAKRIMLDENWSMIGYQAPELLKILTASEDPMIASERRISEVARSLNANQPEAFEGWMRSLPERNRRIAEAAVK